MRTLISAVLAGMMLTAGCGDDDDDDSKAAEPYVHAMANYLQDPDIGFGLDKTQSACAAKAVVEVVGVQKLKDADVSATDLADADDLKSLGVDVHKDAEQDLSKTLENCKLDDAVIQNALDGYAGGAVISDTATECLTDHLRDQKLVDEMATYLVDSSTGSDQLLAATTAAAAACPDALVELLFAGGPAPTAETKDCVTAYVNANLDAVAEATNSLDVNALPQLGADLAVACPTLTA